MPLLACGQPELLSLYVPLFHFQRPFRERIYGMPLALTIISIEKNSKIQSKLVAYLLDLGLADEEAEGTFRDRRRRRNGGIGI